MQVHILYTFNDGPWGGANQFLKAVRNHLEKRDCYENNPEKADVILFNASPSVHLLSLIKYLYRLKKNNPSLLVFIRIDGPIYLIRNDDLELDQVFYKINQLMADGVIFQSEWSKGNNVSLGMGKNINEVVIINAPDANIFNRVNKCHFHRDRKIRLIATSWSSNYKKGFMVYRWLDENLDFSRYEMIFIGNSPIKFNNIKHVPPLSTKKLALELKKSDVYITASQRDPCSNSLIEALHCGLPAIALNDGGHPQLIGAGGETFSEVETIPCLIDKIVASYSKYQNNINVPTIDQTETLYYEFMRNVFIESEKQSYSPKIVGWLGYMEIRKRLLVWRTKQRLISLIKKVGLEWKS